MKAASLVAAVVTLATFAGPVLAQDAGTRRGPNVIVGPQSQPAPSPMQQPSQEQRTDRTGPNIIGAPMIGGTVAHAPSGAREQGRHEPGGEPQCRGCTAI